MFSAIDNNIKKMESNIELQNSMKPAEPWDTDNKTEAKRKARVEKALKDFWYFDKTYYPEDMYSDGYYKPNALCVDVADKFDKPGIHIFLGARAHGKTVTAKKKLAWALLTYKINIGGIYCEDLLKSKSILKDIAALTFENDKIMYDFKLEVGILNEDEYKFRTKSKETVKKWRHLMTFSEKRSVRGATKGFDRPQIMIADDIETLDSSFTQEAVEKRTKRLAETYDSLSGTNASFVVLGNDFQRGSALNLLKLQAEDGILPNNWNVYVYKAWDGKKPLWKERFPAKTEEQLKKMLNVRSESDYQGNFQQNPVPPEGIVFKSDKYIEYDSIPEDARGVAYVDPNCSKKGKGDTTAAATLLYSPTTELFYIGGALCKSYSDSDKLLNDVLELSYSKNNIYALGFDGNVSQESIWTNNIRQWCIRHNSPFRRVEYKRYNVDMLAKNAQSAWNEGLIRFPSGFAKTKAGETFLNQLFSFAGKKANKKDDAPDVVICLFEFIHERGFVKRKGGTVQQNFSIKSDYNF